MKELVLSLENLILKYHDCNDELAAQLIFKEIDKTLFDVFVNANDSFSIVTINKVILPIKGHMEEIKYAMRAPTRSQKIELKKKLDVSKIFLRLTLSRYAEKLSSHPYFHEHLLDSKQEQDTILDPFRVVSEDLLEYFPSSSYQKIIDLECARVLDTYKNKMVTNANDYKNETFLFVSELTQSITLHESVVANLRKRLNDLNIESEGSHRILDLIDEISETEQLIKNLEIYNEGASNLFLGFKQLFFFLNDLQIEEIAPLTVFGDRDYDKFLRFYEELKFFLSRLVTISEIHKVFTLGIYDHPKIELVNGTLNDYGFLIKELKPFFVDDLQVPSNYNNWWSSNFVFSGSRGARRVEKSPRDISNMISNAVNSGDRRPQYITAINGIVSTLR